MSERKQHRTVLITGAAGGVGRATVQAFADAGWSVIGVDRAAFQNLAIRKNESSLATVYTSGDISAPENKENILRPGAGIHAKIGCVGQHRCPANLQTIWWQPCRRMGRGDEFQSALDLPGRKAGFPLLKAAGESAIVIVSSVHAGQTSANRRLRGQQRRAFGVTAPWRLNLRG